MISKASYQASDFTCTELGDITIDQFVDLISNHDWLPDLMAYASSDALRNDCCTPNFNALFSNKAAITIIPTSPKRYSALFNENRTLLGIELSTEKKIASIDKNELTQLLHLIDDEDHKTITQSFNLQT